MKTKSKFEVDVKWVDDTNPDISWLGEYKSKRPDTVYIDRKHETLVDPNNIQFKKFISQGEEQTQECIDFIEEINDLDVYIDSYLEDGNDVVEYYYYEELPFSCNYRNSDYQYVETCNYQLKNLTPEDYKYVIQDTKKLEAYGNDWYMRGCIVKVSLNGIELGSASLWGLDSTMTEDEDKEVIDDLTSEAMEEAKATLKSLTEAEVE